MGVIRICWTFIWVIIYKNADDEMWKMWERNREKMSEKILCEMQESSRWWTSKKILWEA